MGVPKFYRWISERYPCLSEVVKEYQIPEFDNLYFDMNGIVHVCSHPEDDNPHFRITEEKIFQDIFHYIEVLFRMIKPKKVFFMAIDGVAPRAKMNQQRGRRFRSAREAELLVRKAIDKGETLPSEDRFDSNCITPGTEFMVKLQEQLKYFVVNKISTDKLWQGLRIYLSGHETPGEGEHKIMDFIRYERSQVNFDPNTRHCLYGLDADLMMLGLSTHEPHFSLLREEVRFGGKNSQKRSNAPEETVFHLLHLSLFREYLDYEFSELKDKLPYGYDIERIIDDWVLMGFLVGNDFIPHLPRMHIHHDALPLLWKTYKQVMPTIDGYLHDGGTLNLPRFQKFMLKLSEFDKESFADSFDDLKWLESKTESKATKDEVNTRRREQKASVSSTDTGIPTANEFMVLRNLGEDEEEGDLRAEMGAMALEDFEDMDEEYGASQSEALDVEFRLHKDAYYLEKMKLESSSEFLREQAEGYVRALQWILHYYFNGVPSWSWYYPHHYAPYLSDVANFADMDITFDMSTPFMPFQQLMAVLPAASKNLMPKALQPLMIHESSPVIDYYPQEFELDLNGKQQEWEAVVLIPFIDERRLIGAMIPLEENMEPAETARNRHSEHILYEFSPESQGTYTSNLPDAFPHIHNHHAKISLIHKDTFRIAPEKITKGVLPGAITDVYFPGFPTLKHLSHTFQLARTGVKVFQMNSRGENMILTLDNRDIPEIEQVAQEYVGRSVFIDWPHLTESKVIAVADASEKYTLRDESSRSRTQRQEDEEERIGIDRLNMDRDDAKVWCKEVTGITERYKERKGIVIGDTDVLLYTVPLTGRKYIVGTSGRVHLEKQWGSLARPYALQTSVKDLQVKNPILEELKTIGDLYPPGSQVFMLGQPSYGCMGEILDHDPNQEGRLRINFTKPQEPNLDHILTSYRDHETRYMPGYQAGKNLGVSSFLISRITGMTYVGKGSKENPPASNTNRTNVGLNLKYNKTEKEVPGYTRKNPIDNQWLYSSKLIRIVDDYIRKFPELFDYIGGSNEEAFYEEDIYGEDAAVKMKEIKDYIKSLPCSNVNPANFGTQVLDDTIVSMVESVVDRTKENNRRRKRIKMQVKPHLLYRPLDAQSNVVPDPSTTYQLLDRVVNVREGYTVPLGLRGTVTGILAADKEQDKLYEIVFDEEFPGGLTIRCSPNKAYRLPASAMINLTHSERKEDTSSNTYKPTAVVKPLPGQEFSPNRNHPPHYKIQQRPQHGTPPRHVQYGTPPRHSQPGTPPRHSQPAAHQHGTPPRHSHGQQPPPPNFFPHWKSPQPSTSSSSAYQQLRQQAGSQQPRRQHQQSNHAVSGTSQPHMYSNSGGQQQQQKTKMSSPQNTQQDLNFANVWNQLQASNTPQTWNNQSKPEARQALDEAAKALHASKLPQQQQSAGNKTGNNNIKPTRIMMRPPGHQQQQMSGAMPPPPLLAPHTMPRLDVRHMYSVPPPPLPNPGARPPHSQNSDTDDFNRLMAALQSDPVSNPPASSEHTAQEGTQALQQILNVKIPSTVSKSDQQKTVKQPFGKQLSVQELFQGAASKSNDKDEGVNPYQTQRKYDDSQQRKRNPVGELLKYCTSKNMLAPRYDYRDLPDANWFCVVTLPNGDQYRGYDAKDRRQAMDSAATNALSSLVQQHDFPSNVQGLFGQQQSPGVKQHDDTDSHFSASPNSAFTPFKGSPPYGMENRDMRGNMHQHQQPQGDQHATLHSHYSKPKYSGDNQNYPSPRVNTKVETEQVNKQRAAHSGQQKQDGGSDSEVKNPFVPLQVMKKQKTPAKTAGSTDQQKQDGKRLSEKQADCSAQSNSPITSVSDSTSQCTGSETNNVTGGTKVKKQIHFTEKQATESREKKPKTPSATSKSQQPKRPRSRIAAKFN